MASLLSDAPGRLRLRLDAQETRPARLIQGRLAALPGVQAVRLTPRIGSLAIIYDPDTVARDALVGILAAGGVALVSAEPAVQIEYTGVTPASQLIITNVTAANRAVVRLSGGTTDLKVALPLLLVLLGSVRGLFSGFQFTHIPGYLFLWYAFDMFYKLHSLGPWSSPREGQAARRGR